MAKRKTKKSTPKKENRISSFFKNKQTHLGFGVFFVLFSFWLLGAFYSFFNHWFQDQSLLADFTNRTVTAKNGLSKIGASISHFFIYKGFGISAFIIPILVFLTGIYLIIDIPLKKVRKTAFWSLSLIVWTSLLLAVINLKNTLLSGVVGFELNDFLQIYIGKIGVIRGC